SPEAKRLVFTRRDGTGLHIVNVDGSGERQLVAPQSPDFLGLVAWSPDGNTIAYGVGSIRAGLSPRLAATPVAGGPETPIGSRTWYQVGTLRWLPDGRGLVATGNTGFALNQVWYVSYPGGEARSITNDLSNYRVLSLTANAAAMVTIQVE